MILNCKTSRLKLRLGVSNLFDTVTIPRQIRVEEFEIKGAKRRHVMLLGGDINVLTGRMAWQVVKGAPLIVLHIHVAVKCINRENE